MSQRLDRVDELLRQEIGALLEREVADPRIGFVTVTRVETSPDLAHARVWVSLIGDPADRTDTMRALEHAMPYVRRELGRRIRLRRIPALHVHRDESIERGARVLHLIDEIQAGTAGDPLAPDAPAAPAESLPTPRRRRAQAEDAAEDAAEAAPEGDLPGPDAATDRPAASAGKGRGGRTASRSSHGGPSAGRPNGGAAARGRRGTAARRRP
jgi:ribosome-binding factor A